MSWTPHRHWHIPDPAAPVRSGRITIADMARKYANELHANEIMLLAYYIAAVNIETTYHALMGKTEDHDDYEPFPGIVLADTFHMTETDGSLDQEIFPQNNERILRQKAAKINVIVGNPPYSVGQDSANDLNANLKYPALDKRITDTYAKRSSATNKNSLYDSYLRAFRWATDRIGDAGVIAFVSNGGWIDGNTADGIRLSLTDEFSRIYVYNLRGNQRTAGELSRKEGGKVFGSGSRNTVAIFIGVKNPDHNGPCDIRYRDIGDYLSREDKLGILTETPLPDVDWQTVTPNSHGDWTNQRDNEFQSWPVIGEKKPTKGAVQIFSSYSSGLKAGRDAWCYGSSHRHLVDNIENLLGQYDQMQKDFRSYSHQHGLATLDEGAVTEFLRNSPELTGNGRISWSSGLKQQVARNVSIDWSDERCRLGTYRPFQMQWAYMDGRVNDRVYQLPTMFPTPHHENIGILVMAPREGTEFAALSTNVLPDLSFFTYTAQFFPRWTYEKLETLDGGWTSVPPLRMSMIGVTGASTTSPMTSLHCIVMPSVSWLRKTTSSTTSTASCTIPPIARTTGPT